MSAQTYKSPAAIERMRSGMCPECGGAPEGHGGDNRFWMPGNQNCSLLAYGVTERIEWQQQIDAGAVSA